MGGGGSSYDFCEIPPLFFSDSAIEMMGRRQLALLALLAVVVAVEATTEQPTMSPAWLPEQESGKDDEKGKNEGLMDKIKGAFGGNTDKLWKGMVQAAVRRWFRGWFRGWFVGLHWDIVLRFIFIP